MKRDLNNRRCLKFVGYVYLPIRTGEPITYKSLRYYVLCPGPGRIQFFDEKGKKLPGKMKAFNNLGDMQHFIMNEYRRRTANRIPVKMPIGMK